MANKDEEEPYVLNMDVMEDDFYDGMYSFIEDRGINDEFCEELVSICTDLEANNYRQLYRNRSYGRPTTSTGREQKVCNDRQLWGSEASKCVSVVNFSARVPQSV